MSLRQIAAMLFAFCMIVCGTQAMAQSAPQIAPTAATNAAIASCMLDTLDLPVNANIVAQYGAKSDLSGWRRASVGTQVTLAKCAGGETVKLDQPSIDEARNTVFHDSLWKKVEAGIQTTAKAEVATAVAIDAPEASEPAAEKAGFEIPGGVLALILTIAIIAIGVVLWECFVWANRGPPEPAFVRVDYGHSGI
ncbi:MAG: hypothetical protein AB199_02805 [Parcubacteria bacterium C7867-004]|nr:MAG: hypothetical protein AB199_02805 [Parcubacteria bacterium C7867-004]